MTLSLALLRSDPADGDLTAVWILLDAWCNHLGARGRSEATIEQYESYLLRMWRRTRTGPHTLTEQIAESFIRSVAGKGSNKQAYINAAKSFYRWGTKRGLLEEDVASDLETKPPKYDDPDHYSAEEYRALIAAARTRRNVRRPWALQLLLETGARIGSLAEVEPGDVNFETGKLRFRVTKGDRPYSVKMTPAALEAARELVGLMKPGQRTLVGCHKTTLGGWAKQAAVDAGLPPGRQHAHLLRHTAATELYRRTKDPMLVKKFLNHADLSTIHRYAAVIDEEMDSATAASLFEPEEEARLLRPVTPTS